MMRPSRSKTYYFPYNVIKRVPKRRIVGKVRTSWQSLIVVRKRNHPGSEFQPRALNAALKCWSQRDIESSSPSWLEVGARFTRVTYTTGTLISYRVDQSLGPTQYSADEMQNGWTKGRENSRRSSKGINT